MENRIQVWGLDGEMWYMTPEDYTEYKKNMLNMWNAVMPQVSAVEGKVLIYGTAGDVDTTNEWGKMFKSMTNGKDSK